MNTNAIKGYEINWMLQKTLTAETFLREWSGITSEKRVNYLSLDLRDKNEPAS